MLLWVPLQIVFGQQSDFPAALGHQRRPGLRALLIGHIAGGWDRSWRRRRAQVCADVAGGWRRIPQLQRFICRRQQGIWTRPRAEFCSWRVSSSWGLLRPSSPSNVPAFRRPPPHDIAVGAQDGCVRRLIRLSRGRKQQSRVASAHRIRALAASAVTIFAPAMGEDATT